VGLGPYNWVSNGAIVIPAGRGRHLGYDRKGRTFERTPSTIPNLYLAGDYCRSRIDVVSVEAALVTGINAAIAICDRVKPPFEPPQANMDDAALAKSLASGWMEIAAARARSFAARRRQS